MKQLLKILVVGKGARESAIGAKLLESPRTEALYSAPGYIPGATHLEISAMDFEGLAQAVTDLGIDLVVVGPEAPVVEGICDALSPTGAKIIAPDKACARLEGSKEFAKEFMAVHSIPTPRFMTVEEDYIDEGDSFLDSLEPPYVIKADGLAAGKGVFVTDSLADAKDMLHEMIGGLFGPSSQKVLIEEYVGGRECSLFLAVDGEDWQWLPSAHDYKRFEPGNHGLNTGGLGAVSPAPGVNADFVDKVERRIVIPTLRGLKEEGLVYRGFLYLGLVNVEGEPVLLEYNCRLGDPETQAIIPRMQSDLVDILEGIADSTLAIKKPLWDHNTAVAVTLAADGYPGIPVKGDPISGIEAAREMGCIVYPGAMRPAEGTTPPLTDGGRVLTVVGLRRDAAPAAALATRGAETISFKGKYFRPDIGG